MFPNKTYLDPIKIEEINITRPTCKGDSDANVTARVSGGIPGDVDFEWDQSGATSDTYSSGYAAGTDYVLKVTSGDSSDTKTFEVTEPGKNKTIYQFQNMRLLT